MVCGVADTSSPLSATPANMPQGSADSFTSWGSSTPTGVSADHRYVLPPHQTVGEDNLLSGGMLSRAHMHQGTAHLGLTTVPSKPDIAMHGFLKCSKYLYEGHFAAGGAHSTTSTSSNQLQKYLSRQGLR